MKNEHMNLFVATKDSNYIEGNQTPLQSQFHQTLGFINNFLF